MYVVALSRVQVSRDGWKKEKEQARKQSEARGILIGYFRWLPVGNVANSLSLSFERNYDFLLYWWVVGYKTFVESDISGLRHQGARELSREVSGCGQSLWHARNICSSAILDHLRF